MSDFTGWHGEKYVFPFTIIEKAVGSVGIVGNKNNINRLEEPTSQYDVGSVGIINKKEDVVLQASIAKNPYSKMVISRNGNGQ